MKNIITEDIDTSKSIIEVFKESVNDFGFLSDNRYDQIRDAFGFTEADDESIFEQMIADGSFYRLPDGFQIFQ